MKKIGSFVFGLLVISCASTRIYPNEDGTYSLVALGYSDSAAHDAALEDGHKYCQRMGKNFVVVDQKSKYQGVDKSVKVVAGTVQSILGHQNAGYNGTTTDDYKVDLKFRCK